MAAEQFLGEIERGSLGKVPSISSRCIYRRIFEWGASRVTFCRVTWSDHSWGLSTELCRIACSRVASHSSIICNGKKERVRWWMPIGVLCDIFSSNSFGSNDFTPAIDLVISSSIVYPQHKSPFINVSLSGTRAAGKRTGPDNLDTIHHRRTRAHLTMA